MEECESPKECRKEELFISEKIKIIDLVDITNEMIT